MGAAAAAGRRFRPDRRKRMLLHHEQRRHGGSLARGGDGTSDDAAAGHEAQPSVASALALRRFVLRLVEPSGCCQLSGSGVLASASGGGHGRAAAAALPSAHQWSLLCRQLLERIFCPAVEGEATARSHGEGGRGASHAALAKQLDVETAFSTARGQAALPAALEIYSRSLPPQYTRTVHEERVQAAGAHVRAVVAGPAREATLARLGRECLGVWQAGRQLCDAVSLTGRPCAFRVHLLPHESAEPPEGIAAASGCAMPALPRPFRPRATAGVPHKPLPRLFRCVACAVLPRA